MINQDIADTLAKKEHLLDVYTELYALYILRDYGTKGEFADANTAKRKRREVV